MKEGIHPKYYQAKVVCNCGNEFVTGSTKPEIHSTQVSRKQQLPVDVLISSTVSTVLQSNQWTWIEGRCIFAAALI